MCHPTCRSPREQEPGTARKVAETLERLAIDPTQMTAYLRDVHSIGRFRDLCRTHALAIHDGLRKGILADDVRCYPPGTPSP